MRENFNPILPREAYRYDTLKRLVYINLLDPDLDAYSQLVKDSALHSFYHGKAHKYTNKRTFVDLLPVRSLDYNDSLSFGMKGESMTVYLYSELASYFEYHSSFRIPEKEEGYSFSNHQIDKLLVICSEEKYDNESIPAQKERKALRRIIEKTRSFLQERNAECTSLLNRKGEMTNIIICLQSFLSLSLYMRGWDGIGEYPLMEAPIHNQAEIDIRVSEAIVDFELKCDNLLGEPNVILLLPLMWFAAGKYAPSTSRDNLTIRDRLNVLKTGDMTNNVMSCMRLTSNWFLTTALYYLTYLGVKTGINPNAIVTVA